MSEPGYRLQVRLGAGSPRTAGYWIERVAPCTLALPTGEHEFLLTKPGGEPVSVGVRRVAVGDYMARGRYLDRHGTRVVGWTLFGAAVSSPLLLGSAALQASEPSEDGTNDAAFFVAGPVVGLYLFVLPPIIGGTLLVATTPDYVEFELQRSSPAARTVRLAAALGQVRPQIPSHLRPAFPLTDAHF